MGESDQDLDLVGDMFLLYARQTDPLNGDPPVALNYHGLGITNRRITKKLFTIPVSF